MVSMWFILKKSNNWNCSPMEKTEIIIRCIGIYFLVLGFICALQIPMFFEISDKGSIACQICVILMCVPRLFYKNKKWASVLLLICCILTSFALLHFDALAIFLTLTFKQMIFTLFVTAIVLLNFYLCYRLYKLLFKTKPSV
jgi:hypothetical protein